MCFYGHLFLLIALAASILDSVGCAPVHHSDLTTRMPLAHHAVPTSSLDSTQRRILKRAHWASPPPPGNQFGPSPFTINPNSRGPVISSINQGSQTLRLSQPSRDNRGGNLVGQLSKTLRQTRAEFNRPEHSNIPLTDSKFKVAFIKAMPRGYYEKATIERHAENALYSLRKKAEEIKNRNVKNNDVETQNKLVKEYQDNLLRDRKAATERVENKRAEDDAAEKMTSEQFKQFIEDRYRTSTKTADSIRVKKEYYFGLAERYKNDPIGLAKKKIGLLEADAARAEARAAKDE